MTSACLGIILAWFLPFLIAHRFLVQTPAYNVVLETKKKEGDGG